MANELIFLRPASADDGLNKLTFDQQPFDSSALDSLAQSSASASLTVEHQLSADSLAQSQNSAELFSISQENRLVFLRPASSDDGLNFLIFNQSARFETFLVSQAQSSASAELTVEHQLSADSLAQSQGSGVLTTATILAGDSLAQSSATYDFTPVNIELAGASTAQSSGTASVTIEHLLSAASQASAQGTGAFEPGGAGDSLASSVRSVSITIEHLLSGNSLASSGSGSYFGAESLAADSLASSSMGDALLAIERRFYSECFASSQGIGTLDPGAAGDSLTTASLSASITIEHRLLSYSTAQASTVADHLTADHRLYSKSTALASTIGGLVQGHLLRSKSSALSSASSALWIEHRLYSQSLAKSSMQGNLVNAKPLSGQSFAKGLTYGVLSTGINRRLWNTLPFRIAGVAIDLPPSTQLTEAYEDSSGHSPRRMASGLEIGQTYWTRKKVTIQGEGFAPHGLDAIDWLSPQWVDCTTPLSLPADTLTASVPALRRIDVPVVGVAMVGGYSKETPVAMDGNTATLSEVPGAYGYVVQFVPRFKALLERSSSIDRTTGRMSWTVTAEEI